MKAAVVYSFDAPPRYQDFDDPVAGEGEQILTVAAAGLHQIVRGIASGSHYTSQGKLPFVPGVDAVGTMPDGKRVYFGGARFPYGTMSERTVLTPVFTIPLADSLESPLAAAIANPAMSSWLALDRAGFQPGEAVLVLGATGASGHLAVQIAKRRGASAVIAVGRNPEALEEARALGADAIVPLTQEPEALTTALRSAIAEHKVSVVLDYLWGTAAEAVFAALAQKGAVQPGQRVRHVQIGNLAGQHASLDAHLLRSTNIQVLGSGFGSASMEAIRSAIADFFLQAAAHPFAFRYKAVPLADVETVWNQKERDRIVFVP